jgi:hypothetical protein
MVGEMVHDVAVYLVGAPEITSVTKDLICHPHLYQGAAGKARKGPVIVGNDLDMISSLEKYLQAQEFSRPGHAKFGGMVGHVTDQFVPLRPLRDEPLQGKLLPVVGADLYALPGQDLVGLAETVPVF